MTISARQSLLTLFNQAKRASAYHVHERQGAEPRLTPKPAVESGCLNLREMFVMPSASATSEVTTFNQVPIVSQQSKSVPVGAMVIKHSLVAEAGATVIVAAERDVAVNGTIPYFYRDAGIFRVIEPAKFLQIADGDSAESQAPPWNQSLISWADAPSVAFRTTLPRRLQKDVGGDQIVDNILGAIVRGLSVEADRALLSNIEATQLSEFSLANAASRGLRFDELRAFSGTQGTAATVDAAGTLRVSGVQSELTPSCSRTIVGAFNRAAIAIYPEINVHIERLSSNGDMKITVFASLQAIIPDPTAFWFVGGGA